MKGVVEGMNLAKYNKIEELKFLAGNLDTADLFTVEYETILNEAKGDPDQLRLLKRVLGEQTAFMMNQYFNARKAEAEQNAGVAGWN